MPAAPGILPNTVENVIVLDYGTPESLRDHARTRRRAGRGAGRAGAEPPPRLPAARVPAASCARSPRRPARVLDLRRGGHRLPLATRAARRRLFGIRADLASLRQGHRRRLPDRRHRRQARVHGRARRRRTGSTATTRSRPSASPISPARSCATRSRWRRPRPCSSTSTRAGAGAAGHASPRSTAAMVDELNAFCREVGAPIVLKHVRVAVAKVFFLEDHPMQDLLFAMMRNRGVHILDNFPCFMTTAHTDAGHRHDQDRLQGGRDRTPEAGFIPRRAAPAAAKFDASRPPVPGARLGRDRTASRPGSPPTRRRRAST